MSILSAVTAAGLTKQAQWMTCQVMRDVRLVTASGGAGEPHSPAMASGGKRQRQRTRRHSVQRRQRLRMCLHSTSVTACRCIGVQLLSIGLAYAVVDFTADADKQ